MLSAQHAMGYYDVVALKPYRASHGREQRIFISARVVVTLGCFDQVLFEATLCYSAPSILTNIFSKERFASQQLRNTGMNKFLNGGHKICVRLVRVRWVDSVHNDVIFGGLMEKQNKNIHTSLIRNS